MDFVVNAFVAIEHPSATETFRRSSRKNKTLPKEWKPPLSFKHSPSDASTEYSPRSSLSSSVEDESSVASVVSSPSRLALYTPKCRLRSKSAESKLSQASQVDDDNVHRGRSASPGCSSDLLKTLNGRGRNRTSSGVSMESRSTSESRHGTSQSRSNSHHNSSGNASRTPSPRTIRKPVVLVQEPKGELASIKVNWRVGPYDKLRETCDVCGLGDKKVIGYLSVNGNEGALQRLEVVQCQKCGHMWMKQELPDKELMALYGDDYFYEPEGELHLGSDGQWGIPEHGESEVARRMKVSKTQVNEWKAFGVLPSMFEKKLEEKAGAKELLQDPTGGLNPKEETGDFNFIQSKSLKLIEIGGGASYLAQAARLAGMQVTQVELNEGRATDGWTRGQVPFYKGFTNEAVEKADELLKAINPNTNATYTREELMTPDPATGKVLAVPRDSADVVAMYDLLEHITTPKTFLETNVKAILKEGGHVCIRIPITNPATGPTLHLYDHVNHFTEDSLTRFLEENGFEVVHSHHSGTFKAPGKTDERTIENLTLYAKLVRK